MVPTWLYNILKYLREREEKPMNLDFVLDKMGSGKKYELMSNHPPAVSIEEKEEFYIKPTLRDAVMMNNSKLLLFSAPGATGKSALSRYISRSKNALLWDLSIERIANHSFSGMLVKSLGTKEFSRFTEGLVNGEAVLVIDALDEAEMISGRTAIETLLSDLREAVLESQYPSIVLCARTETAHFIKNYYSQAEHRLPLSQYEISFFAETDGLTFIQRKLEETRKKNNDNRPVTVATIECIRSLFDEIKRLLDYDEDAIASFLGYAPVLEALAVFCDEENNTIQLKQKIQNANCSAEIFQKIMEYILGREQRKVINGFRERCMDEYPEFEKWDCVYSEREQLIRLINYVLFEDIDIDVYTHNHLPRELLREYHECIFSFLKDHPFLHSFIRNNVPSVDFTGPAFRDYVLARLMSGEETSEDCDDYAQCYFSEHCQNSRFPSQLYFDLYEFNSGGEMKISHFKYLYDAFKSKERTKYASAVSIEQVDGDIFCTFMQDNALKGKKIHATDFFVSDNSHPLQLSQINNGYIDVDLDIILGPATEDVIISNSIIKCGKLIIQAPNVMLIADVNSEVLIACNGGIDASKCPNSKFEIRAERDDLLKISAPDIDDWYKLRKYKYSLDDEVQLDVTKFENAVWAILKHFRKHRKDAPGKHREYIDNVIVGGSQLKKDILTYFIERGIIYQDSKDPKQYKLNNTALELLGVNWGMLSPNSTREMKAVLEDYCCWKQN